jgi:hypothetical protein
MLIIVIRHKQGLCWGATPTLAVASTAEEPDEVSGRPKGDSGEAGIQRASQRWFAFLLPDCTKRKNPVLSDFDSAQPFVEEYGKLTPYVRPIPYSDCPLFIDFLNGHIDRLQKRVISRKHCFGFRVFTEHPMESLDRIRGINQTSDGIWVLEECR